MKFVFFAEGFHCPTLPGVRNPGRVLTSILIDFFEESVAEGVVDLVEGVDDLFGFILVLHECFWNAPACRQAGMTQIIRLPDRQRLGACLPAGITADFFIPTYLVNSMTQNSLLTTYHFLLFC